MGKGQACMSLCLLHACQELLEAGRQACLLAPRWARLSRMSHLEETMVC